MNNVQLLGRLTKDPELKYTTTGQAVTRFTLAVDRELTKQQREEAEQSGRPTADFINITAWGKTAEFCANYLEKGNRATVQGSIRTGSYVDEDGKRVYTTEVNSYKINPIDWKNRAEGAKTDRQKGEAIEDYADDWIATDDDVPF